MSLLPEYDGDMDDNQLRVNGPSVFPPELSDLMHAGAPFLLANCYVCWFYGGEDETQICCSYPSISLKKWSFEHGMVQISEGRPSSSLKETSK